MAEYSLNSNLRVFELREQRMMFGLLGTGHMNLYDAETGDVISPDELQVAHITLTAVGYRVKLLTGFYSDNNRPAFGTVTNIDADNVYVEGTHDGESYAIPRSVFHAWYGIDTNME